MIDFPIVDWTVTLAHVWAAVALFGIGYVLHEMMHVSALKLLGESYTVHVLPRDEGESLLHALFFGTVIDVEIHGQPPRAHVVACALAPMVFAMPPLIGIALALSYPVVEAGTMLVLGAWFSVAIPSPQDWFMVFTYRPDVVATEVTA